MEVMCVMTDPPAGEPGALSDDLLEGIKDDVRLLCVIVGLCAKSENAWVGVRLQDLARAIGEPGVRPIGHFLEWIGLNPGHRLVRAAKSAAAQRLIDMREGFVYPTQKMADELLAAS